MFRNHSRAARKRGKGHLTSVGIPFSKHELAHQLEDLKSEVRQTIAMQLDTFRIQQKKEEAERALAVFYPRCTRRHPKNECPLHSVEVCLFVRRTILHFSVPPYLGSKPCTKGQKPPLSLSTALTKGGHKDLDLISKGCKGHHKLITTPTS